MSHTPAQQFEFETFPELANRALAGSVIWATDEAFAERENLIAAHEPDFDPKEFGNKGKVYDGWETRRRRHAEIGGHDSAIVRLGVPGLIRGIVVDTAWFKGNYPTHIAVWGLQCDEYLSAEEIAALPEDKWTQLVPETAAKGDSKHPFTIDPESAEGSTRFTHIKLDMIPDGGIARLRVYGQTTPDPRFMEGTVDLAATENGARVTECSNMFFSSPNQILSLGRSINMGGGWENARRRTEGNDHVSVKLAGEGVLRHVEIDTSYFVFNAPGEVQLTGYTADGEQVELVAKHKALPDTRHRFVVDSDQPVTDVRLDVFPDGGIARLRIFGELTKAGLQDVQKQWS